MLTATLHLSPPASAGVGGKHDQTAGSVSGFWCRRTGTNLCSLQGLVKRIAPANGGRSAHKLRF